MPSETLAAIFGSSDHGELFILAALPEDASAIAPRASHVRILGSGGEATWESIEKADYRHNVSVRK